MNVTPDASAGQLVCYNFGQDALAANQTDVQLPVTIGEASQAVTGYEAVFNGDIVAVGYSLSAAGSAGTLTIGATLAGTEDTDSTITITTETDGYKRIERGKIPVTAGQQIGAEITTDGSWNGTTADLSTQVYVLYRMEGI
jgi:hypothetical protein